MDKDHINITKNYNEKNARIERLIIAKLQKYKSVFYYVGDNQYVLRGDDAHRTILLRVDFILGKVYEYDKDLEYIVGVLERKTKEQSKKSRKVNLDLINLNSLLDGLEKK